MQPPDLRQLADRLDAGESAAVVEELSAAVKAQPGHVACLVLLARALESEGDDVRALRTWRAAGVLCPDSPVVRDELRRLAARVAVAAARQTRQDRAVEAAETSLKEDEPYQDLDDLIHELENARIVPDPEVEPVESNRLEPDVDEVASETLAKIYANQKFYEEAARVYEKLADQKADRREEFLEKATELRGRG